MVLKCFFFFRSLLPSPLPLPPLVMSYPFGRGGGYPPQPYGAPSPYTTMPGMPGMPGMVPGMPAVPGMVGLPPPVTQQQTWGGGGPPTTQGIRPPPTNFNNNWVKRTTCSSSILTSLSHLPFPFHTHTQTVCLILQPNWTTRDA